MDARVYNDIEVDIEPPVKFPWMDDAACKGKDYKQFFPDTRQEVQDAKEFCVKHCKKRIECLMFALKAEKPKGHNPTDTNRQHRYGIYGGLDGKERAALQETMDNAGRK